MRLLAAILALAIVLVVLADAFEAMVLPRRATRKLRPARLYYRSHWLLWRQYASLIRRPAGQQYFLAIFGPLSLLGLFVLWVGGLIFAFALWHWALARPLGNAPGRPSLAACLYLSGETLFTLGYGDTHPPPGRAGFWRGRIRVELSARGGDHGLHRLYRRSRDANRSLPCSTPGPARPLRPANWCAG